MRRRISFLFSLLAGVLCAISARADVVHVVYQTSAGDAAATVAETTLETGCDYVTVSAPALDGFIFTHWSSSESDPLVVRDAWGRALDAARFTLYQDVTLTAHYVAATLDSDGDGIPDGHELYWYGNLDQTGDSDTDGDAERERVRAERGGDGDGRRRDALLGRAGEAERRVCRDRPVDQQLAPLRRDWARGEQRLRRGGPALPQG